MVIIMSKNEFINYINNNDIDEDTYIISINDVNTKSVIEPVDNKILVLYFDDIPFNNIIAEKNAINDNQAKQIISFIELLKDKENYKLIIHCKHGLSRSKTIGFYAIKKLNDFMTNMEINFNPIYDGNGRVWTLLTKN